MPNSSGIASTPGDLTLLEGSGRPTVPSWQDSMMVLPVPGPGSLRKPKRASNEPQKLLVDPTDTPQQGGTGGIVEERRAEHQGQVVPQRFQGPGGLWECIEDLQNLSDQDAGLAIRWLMMTATEDRRSGAP